MVTPCDFNSDLRLMSLFQGKILSLSLVVVLLRMFEEIQSSHGQGVVLIKASTVN